MIVSNVTSKTVVSEEELNYCPDCGEAVEHGVADFLGFGLMNIGVSCTECGWAGTEEWVHDKTVTTQ